ncbi:DUF1993 domain-containing protein [Hoeflea alexandrii]|uniref:DUF1993 domain-containing protein n=1 Tax=Hoeflea alexandrii TaxID=288436 RepID=UPI0022B0682B|nr:DUF1993 domain-containing protein [Hoeflea alexandrii]MCZ4288585.1 DUF1993 domain-containing protein [Hoeflea alexandrii]
MSISMHSISVPFYASMLSNLGHVLKKAEAWAAERKIDPAVLLNDRLAPDMLSLRWQVMLATDHAKGAIARLAGVEIPSYPDVEESFDELQARLARTREFIESLPEADFAGAEDKTITLKIGGQEMSFPGLRYFQGFSVPNFYFHMTSAYAILRHNGVPLGKGDFFGRG